MPSETCFYCNAVTSAFEYDHFPIPTSAGGGATVPACLSCHSMKDRVPLGDWPESWLAAVEADLPKVSRETKLFLAKMLRVFYQCRTDGQLP